MTSYTSKGRPMSVVRVQDEHGGSHIEPPLHQAWGDLDKLRWLASVVAFDTGLRVSADVCDLQSERRGRWLRERGYFSVNVEHSSSGPFRFLDAWSYLSGVKVGATARD